MGVDTTGTIAIVYQLVTIVIMLWLIEAKLGRIAKALEALTKDTKTDNKPTS